MRSSFSQLIENLGVYARAQPERVVEAFRTVIGREDEKLHILVHFDEVSIIAARPSISNNEANRFKLFWKQVPLVSTAECGISIQPFFTSREWDLAEIEVVTGTSPTTCKRIDMDLFSRSYIAELVRQLVSEHEACLKEDAYELTLCRLSHLAIMYVRI
jgi:hypothetical protein